MRVEVISVESGLDTGGALVRYLLDGRESSMSWEALDQLGQERINRADRAHTAEQCILAQLALLLVARKMERAAEEPLWWQGVVLDQANCNMSSNTRSSIRVSFANGDTLFTEANGPEWSIRSYYVGQQFNLGNGVHEKLTVATGVQFF